MACQEATWERLGEYIGTQMKSKGVPGVAYGVFYKGELRTSGLGVTSVDNPLDVNDDTLFQIGSISKTYTGTAFMQLVEAGQIELDAPVRKYIPDFKVADEAAAAGVKVRHLLTHMSGWDGDFFEDTGNGDDCLAKYVAKMADLEQMAPLDTVWSYNNSGFNLAGYIMELVTGKSYQTLMQEMVFEPLGLKHTFLEPTDVMTHRFAVGHTPGDNGPKVARPWQLPRSAHPAGAIVSDIKDLLAYGRFHLGDGTTAEGKRLLSAKSFELMHSPQVTVVGKQCWGLTFTVNDTLAARQVSHGGATNGQIASLLLVPEHNFAIALLTNAGSGRAMNQAVNAWALKEYLGLDVPEPKPLGASEEELRPYAGRYTRPSVELELGLLGGRLVAAMQPKRAGLTKETPPPPPPFTMDLCGKDQLLMLDGPMKDNVVDVVRKPDGSIGWIRVGLRIHKRVE